MTTHKGSEKFICENCNYSTSRKSQYNRHILTDKHLILTNTSLKDPISSIKYYKCECGNEYIHRQSLYNHKKKCNRSENIRNNNDNNNDNNKDDIIMMLIKQNSDLIKEQTDIKQLILELIKNGTNNITNNNITTTNSHNKAFNLNFFLNETCKNAMNINDFVDSIKLELNDLERVGVIGYVEGISNIIIKNLNALAETERPVHCTDKKRETIYIKDQGQWEKEDDNKTKLKKAINKIANKNIKLISQFREKYPECKRSESKISDTYNKIPKGIEAMGGPGDNTKEKEEKIIKNITKATTITHK